MKKLFIILVLFSCSCAQQTALTGGTKDVYPPKIVIDSTTLKEPINFKSNEIILNFNENIQFIKGKRSILVNPSIENKEIICEEKKLTVKWEDSLRPKTTYSFNFKESIADLTEKNKIPLLRYTFSTGEYIDSGLFEGNVIVYPQKKPAEEFLIKLQAIESEQREYYGFTDLQGKFKIKNIKNGEYLITAYEDKNKDFLLDTLNGVQGFIIDTIRIIDTCDAYTIDAFEPDKKIKIENLNLNNMGLLEVEFNQSIDSCVVTDTTSKINYYSFENKTKHQFYMNDTAKKYILIINGKSATFCDTLRAISKEKGIELKLLSYKKSQNIGLSYNPNLELLFNQFITSIDTSKLELSKDSIPISYIPSHEKNILKIEPLSGPGNYTLTFFPGSVKGIKYIKEDTSLVNFNLKSNEELSSIELSIKNIPHPNSIVQIIQNEIIKKEFTFINQTIDTVFKNCYPGNYNIKIIADNDKDKYWSTGDIKKQRLPEEIFFYQNEIKLKKNWTTNVTWDFKSLD